MKLNTLRPRRLRRTAAVRSMVRETSLEINDFIYPVSYTHLTLPTNSLV